MCKDIGHVHHKRT